VEENKEPAKPHAPPAHAHHPHHHKPAFAPIHLILAVLIAIVLLVNLIQIAGIKSTLAGEEPAKPALQATLITADCKDCAKLDEIFSQLTSMKQYDVEDQTLPGTDPHSQKLMGDYNITKLPAIVVEGDIEKVALEGFTKSGNALVLQAPAPYYDVKSGSVKGKVSLTYVKADPALCPDCSNITTISAQLKQLGVAIVSENVYTANSADGKRVIDAYKIITLPTVILSSEAKEYSIITEVWSQIGDIAPDGSFVTRQVQPPYYDLENKTVRGRLQFVGLTDATCKECYNVSIHKQIFLSNFGVKFSSEQQYDVNSAEGKNLLAKYNITKVPTIIVTGDAEAYPSLTAVWPEVGTVEKDGAYVFRNLDALQGLSYKDLTTGKVVGTRAGTA